MQTLIVEMDGEAAVLIPDSMMAALGLAVGDEFDLRVEDGRIVIKILPRTARSVSAEAAHRPATEINDQTCP